MPNDEFTPAEKVVLRTLAVLQELTEHQVLRQALRIYQSVSLEAIKGHQLAFVDQQGVLVPRPMSLSATTE